MKLDHVGIVVADLDPTLAFFRDALALEPSRRVDEPGRPRAAFLPLDGAFVELVESTDGQPPPGGASRIEHLGVQVDDLDAEISRIRASGLETETSDPVLKGGRRTIVVAAPPAGVRIQLVERAPAES